MADGRDRKNAKPASNQVSRPVPDAAGTVGASALGQWLATEGGATLPGVAAVLAGAATGVQQAKGVDNLAKGKKATPIQHAALQPVTGGFSLAVEPAMKAFGLGGSATEQEDKRRANLVKKGINAFQFNPGMEEKYNATIREDLPPDFVGFDKDGNWVNNKFASTRDESSLTGRDIDKYAAFSEQFGNDWGNATDDTRFKIGDEAIKRGLLREHHGTLDVNSDQSFSDFAKSLLTTPEVAAATTSNKERTVLSNKPKRQKQRSRGRINWEEITPIGGNKPTTFAYTPESQAPRSVQDYIDAITNRG